MKAYRRVRLTNIEAGGASKDAARFYAAVRLCALVKTDGRVPPVDYPRTLSTFRTRVRIMNTAPIHLVALASLASKVLALPLDIKVSATPPMAPLRPAGLEQHRQDDYQAAQQLQDRDKQGHGNIPPRI